jgi:hypothetical protein
MLIGSSRNENSIKGGDDYSVLAACYAFLLISPPAIDQLSLLIWTCYTFLMQTALLILKIAVLTIAVGFFRSWFKTSSAHRLLSDARVRASERLSSSKLFVRLRMMTKESCPYCSTMNMRRLTDISLKSPSASLAFGLTAACMAKRDS